ncbi:diacylglycerol/lipid kinase family protein [Mesonia ostreae]|uniref:Diacylglycerol kinase family protein n=1 Tax=Mesonia ostreae TaxID=861110 RepID=A0ABU2KF02_9FLAO|nr:diacylglycerol kinase family protein [Mesonia ostreae]MDT0293282.1 diacylglycerol kinase family protein [Mesonia ostreae]
MKILLVINPISGDSNKESLISSIKQRTSSKIEIFRTTGKDDIKKIKNLITENELERILVAGGDGTIKLVAEAMEDESIPIGILPLGSANGLASDLNLPLEQEAFIKVALGDKKKQIDAININDQLCLHISDLGLNAELIKEYEQGTFRGKFGYALQTIPTLFNTEGPYDFTIKTNDKTINRKGIMLAIANSKQFGTGAVVNATGEIDDGIFELLLFKKLDIFEVLKTLKKDAQLSPEFLEVIPTKKASIQTLKNVDFQIDGEYCKALKYVEAEILPKKLSVFIS